MKIRHYRGFVWLLGLVVALSSCENTFEFHPYSGRLTGETGINQKNIARIEESCKGLKDFKFALISDTQRWYDDTVDAVNDINQRGDIRFVINAGDVSDFGVTKEFLWQRDIMNGLTVPYVVCLGNHDCIGTGDQVFNKVFGNPNFSFQAGNVLFVGLNTVALEYDYSHPVPDFGFIEEQMHPSDTFAIQKTVYVMHCRPTDEQFNNNVATYFNYCIKQSHHTQFCLCGHNHNTQIKDIFGNGILYFGIGCINKRSYFVFHIKENGYDYEEVSF